MKAFPVPSFDFSMKEERACKWQNFYQVALRLFLYLHSNSSKSHQPPITGSSPSEDDLQKVYTAPADSRAASPLQHTFEQAPGIFAMPTELSTTATCHRQPSWKLLDSYLEQPRHCQ